MAAGPLKVRQATLQRNGGTVKANHSGLPRQTRVRLARAFGKGAWNTMSVRSCLSAFLPRVCPSGPFDCDGRCYSCDTPLFGAMPCTGQLELRYPPCDPPMASLLNSLHECFWPCDIPSLGGGVQRDILLYLKTKCDRV